MNGADSLDWPVNDGDPINEFCPEGLATMAFPTLFPMVKGTQPGLQQRHQLLSQAPIYLTQNPEDANLMTEELRQMVGQMTANHLMNRVQHHFGTIQGTK